jgi:hypothetical protein
MTNSEVISAFIDNEPFDSQALADALAQDEGRALLLDLIALRGLAQPDDAVRVAIRAPARRTRPGHLVIAAAAVVVALAGGFKWGERSVTTDTSTPPAPSRVVSGGTAWVEATAGGGR